MRFRSRGDLKRVLVKQCFATRYLNLIESELRGLIDDAEEVLFGAFRLMLLWSLFGNLLARQLDELKTVFLVIAIGAPEIALCGQVEV